MPQDGREKSRGSWPFGFSLDEGFAVRYFNFNFNFILGRNKPSTRISMLISLHADKIINQVQKGQPHDPHRRGKPVARLEPIVQETVDADDPFFTALGEFSPRAANRSATPRSTKLFMANDIFVDTSGFYASS